MDETADKLDSMMELVVGYIGRRDALGELHGVFSTLLRSFDHSLLHVHRSKFTQFLLFYVRPRGALVAARGREGWSWSRYRPLCNN